MTPLRTLAASGLRRTAGDLLTINLFRLSSPVPCRAEPFSGQHADTFTGFFSSRRQGDFANLRSPLQCGKLYCL